MEIIAHPALPAHLVPAVVKQNLGPMAMVSGVLAHPVGKGEVMRKQFWVVAPGKQACALGVGRGVEQADGDAGELVSRGRGVELAGRHGVAAEQEVPARPLRLQRALHGELNRLLAPAQTPLGGEAERGQLDGDQVATESRSDAAANRGLPHAARPRYQQEHAHPRRSCGSVVANLQGARPCQQQQIAEEQELADPLEKPTDREERLRRERQRDQRDDTRAPQEPGREERR